MHTTLLQTPSVAVSLILVLIIQRREVIGDNSPCNRTKAKVELGQKQTYHRALDCLVRYWLVAHMCGGVAWFGYVHTRWREKARLFT